jgi:transmembrane 9 superfamily protein 1
MDRYQVIAMGATQNVFNAPRRTNRFPREVPRRPWYHHSLMLATGLLPFGHIYIELHLTLLTIWGYQVAFINTVVVMAGDM